MNKLKTGIKNTKLHISCTEIAQYLAIPDENLPCITGLFRRRIKMKDKRFIEKSFPKSGDISSGGEIVGHREADPFHQNKI